MVVTTDWGSIIRSRMGEITMPMPKPRRPIMVAATSTIASAGTNSEAESKYASFMLRGDSSLIFPADHIPQ